MRKPAGRKSKTKSVRYIAHISGGKKPRSLRFSDRDPALKLAEDRASRGFQVVVVNHMGQEIFRSSPKAKLEYEIISDGDQFRARVYDAPYGGWRPLFARKNGAMDAYDDREQALAGVRIYDSWYKDALLEAEIAVWIDCLRTRSDLSVCGLPALVRFGAPDHYVYAAYTLPADFIIKRSDLKIIVNKGEEPAND